MADAFDIVYGQPQVRDFLRACVAQGRVSHAYLFTGMAGSNKTQAAYSFAEEILKSDAEPDKRDDVARKVRRRVHPDVRHLSPEGAQGYLVDQIREVVSDVQLAPIQAKRKIYIIDRADLLGTAAANAFLKTLEEPPDDVVLILLGRNVSAILPTIVSRCQVVPFRQIPLAEASAILVQNTGCSTTEASIAIEACGGSVTQAAEFLRSPERAEFRRKVLTALASLARADDLDVLDYANSMVLASKSPLDEVRRSQEELLEQSAEFLQKSALKQLADKQKRALSQASVTLLRQMTQIVRSWLRDVMAICAGTPEQVINVDAMDALRDCASRTTLERACRATECATRAEDAIMHNVSPQVSIEAMLFETREVLYA